MHRIDKIHTKHTHTRKKYGFLRIFTTDTRKISLQQEKQINKIDSVWLNAIRDFFFILIRI